MREHKHTLAIVVAAALCLAAAHTAHAERRGYVINLFVPAMNNNDDSDCPQGKNPTAPGILERILAEQGMPKTEIDKLMTGFNNGVFNQYATMRGRVDGKPVNVYHHPMSVPDPHITLAVMKEAFGFNLDGKDGPGKYVDPLTGEKGVNNAAARVFGCFDRTRGTLETPPVNWSVRWNYYSYGNSWLIEIKTPDDRPLTFKDDDVVEVTFYRGLQPPIKNSQGYQRDMTYSVDPDPRLQGNTFKGKIRNGMFQSDQPFDFKLIASTRLNPVFDFKRSRLRLAFKPDGALEGLMGGFMPITMVYFPFGNYANGAEFNGGMDIPGVYYALRQQADTDIDADPTTGARTRISQTYLIRAVPAFLVRSEATLDTNQAGGRSGERPKR